MGSAPELKDWNQAISAVLKLPPHLDLALPKSLGSPLNHGFSRSLGEFRWQIADYRLSLKGRSIHVVEYPRRYLVHWDHADPTIDPAQHLIKDAPHWIPRLAGLFSGAASAGISYLITRSLSISILMGIGTGMITYALARSGIHLLEHL